MTIYRDLNSRSDDQRIAIRVHEGTLPLALQATHGSKVLILGETQERRGQGPAEAKILVCDMDTSLTPMFLNLFCKLLREHLRIADLFPDDNSQNLSDVLLVKMVL